MYEARSSSTMVQRRSFTFILRIFLLLIGILLVWKMVTVMWNLDGSNLQPVVSVRDGKISNPILVEVYYESMCPDSKYFIKKQLVPTVGKISEIVEFKLIPYGKAHTIENGTGIYFTCQHQERECQGNKVHACAIQYVKDQSKLLNYVSCLFNNMQDPEAIAEKCSSEVGVDWEAISKCSKSSEGSELLKKYGEATHSLDPPVSFIPTILLNKSQGNQKDILKSLLTEVCALSKDNKPPACASL